VDRIVLEHVRQVINRQEIVDRDDFDVVSLRGRAKYHPSDPTEAVDTDPNHGFASP
jgi:hypothetical protein